MLHPTPPSASPSYCFCTLAVGQRYRQHAKMLAADLQTHAPSTPLIVLSDRPTEFAELPNVKAFKHRLRSTKGYHDKRFVLAQALALFESCIFVDADVRILGPVPEDIPFAPGIVARYGCGIIKHNTEHKIRAPFAPIQVVASTLNLNLPTVSWMHECMFLASRQQGKEKAFFQLWQSMAYYFENLGIYCGEGNIIGLAAAKSGFNLRFHRHDFFPCFKDSIYKEQIKQGTHDPHTMAEEFAVHRAIEYPKRSRLQKVQNKVSQALSFRTRWLAVKWRSRQDKLTQTFLRLHAQQS
ncbi:MAG: hypothetical protein AAF703_14465 [Cyanobacteria bacterium P01_D01_bin.105]